jgi:hypothetical protein
MSKNIFNYNIISNPENNNGYIGCIGPTGPAGHVFGTTYTNYTGYTSYTRYIGPTGPIQQRILLSSNNLSNLNNTTTVRTNLDVYSIEQTNNAIVSNFGLFIDIYSDTSIWIPNAYQSNEITPSTTIDVADTTNLYTETYDIKITNG